MLPARDRVVDLLPAKAVPVAWDHALGSSSAEHTLMPGRWPRLTVAIEPAGGRAFVTDHGLVIDVPCHQH